MREDIYDPRRRERAKQDSRAADERALVSGQASRAELRRANAFVPPEMARAAVILDWPELD